MGGVHTRARRPCSGCRRRMRLHLPLCTLCAPRPCPGHSGELVSAHHRRSDTRAFNPASTSISHATTPEAPSSTTPPLSTAGAAARMHSKARVAAARGCILQQQHCIVGAVEPNTHGCVKRRQAQHQTAATSRCTGVFPTCFRQCPRTLQGLAHNTFPSTRTLTANCTSGRQAIRT